MNTLFSRWQTKGRTGLVHSTLLLAMLLGNLPLTVAQAASPSTSIATCEAPATGNIGKVFLPVILSAGSNLVATAQSLPTTPLAIPRQLRYQVGKTYVYAWDLKISSKTVAYDSEGLHDNGTMTTYVRALADVSISEKGVDNVYTGQVVLRNPFVCSTDGTDQSVLDDPSIRRETRAGSVSFSVTAMEVEGCVVRKCVVLVEDVSVNYVHPENPIDQRSSLLTV